MPTVAMMLSVPATLAAMVAVLAFSAAAEQRLVTALARARSDAPVRTTMTPGA